MKKLPIITAAALGALAACCVWGEWVYEGQWGSEGGNYGEFAYPHGIAVAPNGNVYVADVWNCRIQYFTSTGSFLGYWDSQFWQPMGVAVSPNGKYVYVADSGNSRIRYFTPQGSVLGEWGRYGFHLGEFDWPYDISVSPEGNVFVSDTGNNRIQFFTPLGSYLGAWRPERWYRPEGIVCASRRLVYVAEPERARIHYFRFERGLSSGEYWGSPGGGNGQLSLPTDVAFATSPRRVFVTDCWNHRVQYFTRWGAFLGKWGSYGTGPGEFAYPGAIAVAPNGYVYVTEGGNHRVQYFRWSAPAVSPTSVGRVKALFK